MVDVYAATIPGVKFIPVLHVNYAETVPPMKGWAAQLKDFPAEMGGWEIPAQQNCGVS